MNLIFFLFCKVLGRVSLYEGVVTGGYQRSQVWKWEALISWWFPSLWCSIVPNARPMGVFIDSGVVEVVSSSLNLKKYTIGVVSRSLNLKKCANRLNKAPCLNTHFYRTWTETDWVVNSGQALDSLSMCFVKWSSDVFKLWSLSLNDLEFCRMLWIHASYLLEEFWACVNLQNLTK